MLGQNNKVLQDCFSLSHSFKFWNYTNFTFQNVYLYHITASRKNISTINANFNIENQREDDKIFNINRRTLRSHLFEAKQTDLLKMLVI